MKLRAFLAILAGVLVAGVAITDQSLWIDEANAAWKAVQPDAASFAHELTGMLSSDTQMPGYMAGLWAWEKIFGHREWVLRAFNLPWLMLGCWVLMAYWRVSPSLRALALLLLLASPFTWFYLDEARPYAMQIGAGLLATCATYHLLFQRDRQHFIPDLVCFLLGTLMLSISSLFAMLLAFLFFITLGLGLALSASQGRGSELLKNRRAWAWLGVFALPFSCLALYYLWTLALGARASSVGQTGLLNLAFVLYELAGFNGLGPDRNSIRESMAEAFRPYLPTLVLGLAAYVSVLVGAWHNFRREDTRHLAPLLLAFGFMTLALAVSFLVGVFGEFRLLGRHLTPVFPVFLLGWSAFLALAWRHRWGRWTALFFLGVMLTASLSQRFNPRFAKDDYRGAVSLARQAMDIGQVVWWAADGAAARYYGIHPVHQGEAGQVFHANNRDQPYLEQLPQPSLIILSKADVYDQQKTLRKWLTDNGWIMAQRLPGFSIWAKEP